MEQNKPLQQRVNIDLSQSEALKCTECDSEQFKMRYMIRKISALLSPTSEEMLIPVQVFACGNCGHIPDEFLPNN